MEKSVYVISGGTRGIGAAVADRLARGGATVYVTSRRQGGGELAAARPGAVTVATLDVTDEKSVDDLFSAIARRHGYLSGLLNNAGVGVFKRLVETSFEEWKQVIATNLTGAFLCTRAALRLMESSGGGRIVNVGSIADCFAIADNGAYASSKHGLRGLGLVAAEEGREAGVRVTHVSLGAVATALWADRTEVSTEAMLPIDEVADEIARLLVLPLSVRVDEVRLFPPKGVL